MTTKERAVKNLINLNCFPAYKEAFRRSDKVTMYEGFGGYYIDKGTELDEKIKEIQSEYNGIVYAVIHNMTEFGDIYTMLWESGDDEGESIEKYDGINYVFAYVWNKDVEEFSEFGDVGIVAKLGGLLRVS